MTLTPVALALIFLIGVQCISPRDPSRSCFVCYGVKIPRSAGKPKYYSAVARTSAKNEANSGNENDEPLEDLGRRERKKRQRQQDYERRREMWLDRYGSASALRKTFGAGPPWGDLSPQQTRVLYHSLLPRSLLALSEMELMKPEELAPMAYEARIAAKEYARSRCVWTGRVATWAFDQYRSLRDNGRLLGPGASSSMSWEEVWNKYEAQIVQEECSEVIDGSCDRRKKKEKALDEQELTMRIYMRILERSCVTNEAFDAMFLSNDGEMDSDLAAIANHLEEDVRSILLSPKESEKIAKKAEKMYKRQEKQKVKEEKRQRRVEKKEGKEGKKALKREEKMERKRETRERDRQRKEKEDRKSRGWAEVAKDTEIESNTTSAYSQRSEALRILADTRRKFQILFPHEKNE